VIDDPGKPRLAHRHLRLVALMDTVRWQRITTNRHLSGYPWQVNAVKTVLGLGPDAANSRQLENTALPFSYQHVPFLSKLWKFARFVIIAREPRPYLIPPNGEMLINEMAVLKINHF
jgi:hypothetical protein